MRVLFSYVLYFNYIIWFFDIYFLFLYIFLNISALPDVQLTKMLSVGYQFAQLTWALLTEDFQFHEVPLIFFSFCVFAISTLLRKSFPVPMHSRLPSWMYLILCWCLWSFRSWVLYMGTGMNLFPFFNMNWSSLISTICWRYYFYSTVYFLAYHENIIFLLLWGFIFDFDVDCIESVKYL